MAAGDASYNILMEEAPGGIKLYVVIGANEDLDIKLMGDPRPDTIICITPEGSSDRLPHNCKKIIAIDEKNNMMAKYRLSLNKGEYKSISFGPAPRG
jgi:hypothetical protein